MGIKRVSIRILMLILGILLVLPAATYGSTSLTSLRADPSSIKIEDGSSSSPIVLKAVYGDASWVDVTSTATWKSNDEAIATVAGGIIKGVSSGVTNVNASYGGKNVNVYVQVTPRLLHWNIQSSDITIPKGQYQIIAVTAFYENGTKNISQSAVFESGDSSIVSVRDNKLTGLKLGETDVTVTVKHGEVIENKSIHVTVMPPLTKLELDTMNLALVKDDTRTVKLTATYSANDKTAVVTDQATWSSRNENIATVENGMINAKRKGSTTITATYGGRSVTINVTVTSPINILDVSLDSLILAKGKVQTIKVYARYTDSSDIEDVSKYASIKSSNPGIITVSGSLIKALDSGTAILTIEYGGIVKTVDMVVTLPVTKLVADTTYLGLENGDSGNTGTLKLTATYIDNTSANVTDLARWSTSNANIATVNNGEITAVGKGNATITGTYGGLSVRIEVKVTLPIVRLDVSPGNVALTKGRTQTITVTAVSNGLSEDVSRYATITSDNEEVAIVTGNSVKVLSNKGNAKLTISYGTQEVTMWVYATDPIRNLVADTTSLGLVIDATGTVGLTATYNDANSTTEDVTEKASLTSSNIKIVTIENGLIKGLKKGSATVTATYGGRSVRINVTVTSPVNILDVSLDSLILAQGKAQTIKVYARYTDSSEIEDVSKYASIKSSDPGIITVSGSLIKALNLGTAILTIEYGGIVKTVDMDVTLPVTKLVADTTYLGLETGESGNTGTLKLTATYSDNMPANVTDLARWSTSNANIATVNNGEITAVGKGNATITGTYGGLSVRIEVKVTLPIVRLDVSPGNVALTKGRTQTITVTAVSNGLSEDVSRYVTITSDNEEVAIVTGNSVKVLSNKGNAKLTISYGIQEITMWVYATDPIRSLVADTTSLGLVIDATGTVGLTATYNDTNRTTEDVTEKASLTSSNIKIVTIENGLIKGLKKGSATVIATYGGRSVRINVRVTSPVKLLSADDDSVLMTKGKTQNIKVRAVYNDENSSIEEVSKYASIISNNTEIVKVNGNSIIAAGEGKATLTIEYGGLVKTVNVVVKLPVTKLATDGLELKLIKAGSGAINLYAKYSDGSEEEVSLLADWKSSNVGIVTVNYGYLTGVGKGTATITGTYGGKTVSVKVTVTLS